ncbi:SURF1 family protein [Microbacterium sp. zg.B48]|uniref:SURF1 family protein n=1 Tax=unclassified Microbacterium TaxID=2609290 RepID=UPI00214B0629|nr:MULTISPECIES: SURF1 family cytochrome oxidase biogenesis protein [unclassified Microbacterium]MCR2764146.1 SURF1 family protein [Microbacterium sp. zg.B48]MCR2808987.1 SURF1 family protein [Microbacterium sp. zg.B185]WIM18600.1 SURF1 family cytochrome oxidase biogenesis protein [Microbacterium sp. zg-B185]
MTSPDLPEVFPPTLREVLLRPQWIALLALCLVVAGVFAWLGQWQLGRAVDMDPTPPGATEEVRPIAEVVEPGQYLSEPLVGQRVTVTGTWVPDDFIIVASRFNDGAEGYWVTGQFRVAGDAAAPVSVAVAIGWAPTLAEAEAAVEVLNRDAAAQDAAETPLAITGRLISDEGTALPPSGADPFTLTRMSPAALLSRWHDADGLSVYRQYVAAEVPQGPLEAISSPAPEEGSDVNWLNIFYAAEWAVFAGFAFYLWYRLARDAWEKELEDLEDAAAAASGPDGPPESRG